MFFPPSSGNSSTFGGKSALHGTSFPLKPAPSPSWSRRSPKKAPRRFLSAAEEVTGLGTGKSWEILGLLWDQSGSGRAGGAAGVKHKIPGVFFRPKSQLFWLFLSIAFMGSHQTPEFVGNPSGSVNSKVLTGVFPCFFPHRL